MEKRKDGGSLRYAGVRGTGRGPVRVGLLPGVIAAGLLAAPVVRADEFAEMRETVEPAFARPELPPAALPAPAPLPAPDLATGMAAPPGTAGPASSVPDFDGFQDLQQAAPHPGNRSLDPALKGFVAIPGTSTLFKLGGSARVDAIANFANNGNPNLFQPSPIPLGNQPRSGGDARTTLLGKATRLSLEIRRPTGQFGNLRIYNENDFFGDSGSNAMTFRVRHFYGQAWNFLIGQTLTGFMNPDAWPDVLDYQGPAGILNRRQAQVRYPQPLRDHFGGGHAYLSVEYPQSDLATATLAAGAQPRSTTPDLVLGGRREGESGNLQLAMIGRSLGFESDTGREGDTTGWGGRLSGSLVIGESDSFPAQIAYGEGIARYVNDFSGANLDAASTGGELETIDAYPTAIKLGVILTLHDATSALRELREALEAKAAEFADVLKMGRTENQAAVPMTLGQEFGAHAVMIGDGIRYLNHPAEELHEVNMGATAIGTGINSPPGYAELCTRRLDEISGLPVTLAGDLVEATQGCGGFSLMGGAMKTAAVQLSKICNDLRWLSSDPRCGLYEIRLPAMQPGSSIMPGKVNPVIPEVVSQVCYQIIGADVTVSMASEASELELNMAEPVIAFNLLFGLTLLRNAAIILNTRCISGIQPNRERCMDCVRNSIGLVTALNPVLGYQRSAAIAKEALATGGSVYDLVLGKGWLSKEQPDDLLSPERMTSPRAI